MTGGGFGGCGVALGTAAQADAIAESIAEDYLGSTGIQPILFITKPSDGPRILLQP
jgi:galactokinase